MSRRISNIDSHSPGQSVIVFTDNPNSGATLGYCGVIRRLITRGPTDALCHYRVFLPYFDREFEVSADDLFATGRVDPSDKETEAVCELRFDNPPAEDNDEIAGSYRIPPCDWEFFEFRKAIRPVATYQLSMPAEPYLSSTSSLRYQVPRALVLDRSYVLKAMGELIGHADWTIR